MSGLTRRQRAELLYGPPDPWMEAAEAGALRSAQDMLFGGICAGDDFIVMHAVTKLDRLGGRDMEGHSCQLCGRTSDEAGEPVYAYGEAVTSMGLKAGWHHNSCVRAKRVEYDAARHEAAVQAKKEEKMAGLVVDVTGSTKGSLHTTETMDPKTGKKKVAPYKGKPIVPGEALAVTMPEPKVSRGVVARKHDDMAALSGPEVIAMAVSMGYQEPPTWPNGGVRVMRARNFIRNARKKQGAA